MFNHTHDTQYDNENTPRMACLDHHMRTANYSLNRPFTTEEMPGLYKIVNKILKTYDNFNKPCMSIAMGIDIMIENDTINVIKIYKFS
jgi:hypothetical protein